MRTKMSLNKGPSLQSRRRFYVCLSQNLCCIRYLYSIFVDMYVLVNLIGYLSTTRRPFVRHSYYDDKRRDVEISIGALLHV